MEFWSRCKRGGEVVCRDWWLKNIKEVTYGGANRLRPKAPMVCAKAIAAGGRTASKVMYLQLVQAWRFIIFKVESFITR